MAVAIALGIYALALGTGSALYATGLIATGATHNDCADFKKDIAEARGIDEKDVTQGEIKAAAQTCLDGHELTEWHAFQTEYLFWGAWPAVVCAVIFLAWPVWARILSNQEEAEDAAEAARLEMGA